MSITPGSLPGTEGRWDIPHLMRGDYGVTACFVSCKKLAPTALLPAIWNLHCPSGQKAFIYDIYFSTDTNIEVQLRQFFGVVGTPGNAIQNVGRTAGAAVASSAGAGVVADPGGTVIDGFFAGANTRIPLLNRTWIGNDGSDDILVVTSAVAANCYCAIYWTDVQI